MDGGVQGGVTLRPWDDDGFAVLSGQDSPAMTAYLGGPEGPERVAKRHERYLRLQNERISAPFTIRVAPDGVAVGSVVYWQTQYLDVPVYEIGWGVLPQFQGHGYGTRAVVLALAHAAAHGDRDTVWAFPRVDNPASNGVARSAAFVNGGTVDGEYPAGVAIRVNAWSFDLNALR